MLRMLGLVLCFGLLATVSASAATHPFSVHDMLAMERISDPRVSPDGRLVAFTVRATDLDANKGRNDLYVAAVDGTSQRRLTTSDASDTQPRWAPDGSALFFVSTRSGSAQVW
ncbi:MAG: family peptidase, partial [Acidobacteria bacterium]|nr:family peptidase [Acidobacteriota bacterium]